MVRLSDKMMMILTPLSVIIPLGYDGDYAPPEWYADDDYGPAEGYNVLSAEWEELAGLTPVLIMMLAAPLVWVADLWKYHTLVPWAKYWGFKQDLTCMKKAQ